MISLDKHRKTFYIPYYDTSIDGTITPYNILKYFGETSNSHTDKILSDSEGEDYLNYGWMLYRWKVKIDKYPKAMDKIYVETWVSKLDRFYAYREFQILNEKNEVLARASTVWIFVDMEKKRPVRIPSFFTRQMKAIGKSNFKEFENFKRSIQVHNNIDFKVRRSDIDYNNHVNNTKYLLWILEAVPDNIYKEYMLYEFEIIYKKEIKYGDTILSGYTEFENTRNKENMDKISFIHKISGKSNNDDHAYGKSKWVRK